MCKLEDEFIYNSVDTNCSANELKFSVCRIIEDKVVAVKGREVLSPNSAGQL